MKPQTIITYQNDRGMSINLTTSQVATLKSTDTWPRDEHGREYCSVSHGQHYGNPTWTDVELTAEVEQI